MQLLPATESMALKEWAVAVRALGLGEQAMVLRKGGIHREDRRFRVLYPEFLLFPSYEHQKPELLKLDYHAALQNTLEEDDVPDLVTLTHWCQATDVFETSDEAVVDSLSAFHVWAGDYAQKRLHWRPKQPLTVALLRVYRLQQPQALPVLDEYAGCKSWVDLGQQVPLGRMFPVLDDSGYEDRTAPIRAHLAAKATRVPVPTPADGTAR